MASTTATRQTADKPNRSLGKRARRLLKRIDGFISRQATIGEKPVYTADEFAWTAELERAAPVIRHELDAVMRYRADLPKLYELQREQSYISGDGRWKSFFLYGWGFPTEEGRRLCPETMRIVAGIPGMQTAFFSVLEPGAHIPEHKGISKSLLRGQLALIVPREREKCTIWIDRQPYHWQEGRSLIFDDTYLHEVRNDTDEARVVLLYHFARPLNPVGRLMLALVVRFMRRSKFVQEAKGRYEAWAKSFRPQMP
jgi:Aspartyl/asparaginyl beta-hydroxylase and related dioxygenases